MAYGFMQDLCARRWISEKSRVDGFGQTGSSGNIHNPLDPVQLPWGWCSIWASLRHSPSQFSGSSSTLGECQQSLGGTRSPAFSSVWRGESWERLSSLLCRGRAGGGGHDHFLPWPKKALTSGACLSGGALWSFLHPRTPFPSAARGSHAPWSAEDCTFIPTASPPQRVLICPLFPALSLLEKT